MSLDQQINEAHALTTRAEVLVQRLSEALMSGNAQSSGNQVATLPPGLVASTNELTRRLSGVVSALEDLSGILTAPQAIPMTGSGGSGAMLAGAAAAHNARYG